MGIECIFFYRGLKFLSFFLFVSYLFQYLIVQTNNLIINDIYLQFTLAAIKPVLLQFYVNRTLFFFCHISSVSYLFRCLHSRKKSETIKKSVIIWSSRLMYIHFVIEVFAITAEFRYFIIYLPLTVHIFGISRTCHVTRWGCFRSIYSCGSPFQRETSFNFRAKFAAILIVSKYMSVSFAWATVLGKGEKGPRLEFASRYRLVELVITRGLFWSAWIVFHQFDEDE